MLSDLRMWFIFCSNRIKPLNLIILSFLLTRKYIYVICSEIDQFISLCPLFWTVGVLSIFNISGNCILTHPAAAPFFRVISDSGVDA